MTVHLPPDTLTTAVLQIVRLKGRVSPDAVAASLAFTPADATACLQSLQAEGAIGEAKGQYRMTLAGRETLAQRITAEAAGIDRPALAAAYDEFHHLNTEFKTLVTAWQMRDGQPNDHTDAQYDQRVILQLAELDQRWVLLLGRMVALVPRLGPYPARFMKAVDQLQRGDATWFARPVQDSYHTVWFELHEDLIGLLGLSRVAEAAAGRAE